MNTVEEYWLDCPYCGESMSVLVDCSCADQTYTEDCQICCRPMVLSATVNDDEIVVSAQREDD